MSERRRNPRSARNPAGFINRSAREGFATGRSSIITGRSARDSIYTSRTSKAQTARGIVPTIRPPSDGNFKRADHETERVIFSSINTARVSHHSQRDRPAPPASIMSHNLHRHRSQWMMTHMENTIQEKMTLRDVIDYCRHRLAEVQSRKHDPTELTAVACDLLMTYASCTGNKARALQPLVQVLMNSIYKDLTGYQPKQLGAANVVDLCKRDTYLGEYKRLLRMIEKAYLDIRESKRRTKKLRMSRIYRQKVLRNAITEWQKNIMYLGLKMWRQNAINIKRQRVLLHTRMEAWNHRQRDPDFTRKVWVLDFLRMRVCLRKLTKAMKRYNFRKAVNESQRNDITDYMKKLNALRLRVKNLEKDFEEKKHHHFILSNELDKSEKVRERLSGFRYEFALDSFLDVCETLLKNLKQQLEDIAESDTPDMRRMWFDDPCRVFSFTKSGALEELTSASEQDIILMWVNFQLRNFGVKRDKSKNAGSLKARQAKVTDIGNFTSDMRGGLVLLKLLVEVLPEEASYQLEKVLNFHEPHERVEHMLKIFKAWNPQLGKLINEKHIMYEKDPTVLVAFIGRLLCMYPSLPSQLNASHLADSINDLLDDIDAVREMNKKKRKKSSFYKEEFFCKPKMPTEDPATKPQLFQKPKYQMMAASLRSGQTVIKQSQHHQADKKMVEILSQYSSLMEEDAEVKQDKIDRLAKKWRENGRTRFSKAEQFRVEHVSQVDLKNIFTHTPEIKVVGSPKRFSAGHKRSNSTPTKFFSKNKHGKQSKKGSIRELATLHRTRRNKLRKVVEVTTKSDMRHMPNYALKRPSRKILSSANYDYHEWVVEYLGPKLEQVFTLGSRMLEDSTTIQRAWKITRAKMECFVIRLLNNRLRQTPEALIDHHLLRERKMCTSLHEYDFKEIFREQKHWDSMVELKAVEASIRTWQLELKKIFLNYAQDDSTDSSTTAMNEIEYWSFLKDSRLLNSRCNKRTALRIFNDAVEKIVAATRCQRSVRHYFFADRERCITHPVPLKKSGQIDLKVNRELSRQDFIHVVLRLAYVRQSSGSLASRLDDLMRILSVNTRQLQATYFRQHVRSESFYKLFAKYRWHLRNIYVYFAAQIVNPTNLDSNDESMNLKEWSDMLRCARLLEPDGPITVENMETIFSNSRTEEYTTAQTSNEEEALLTYTDFLEAVVILACFRYSDPYESMRERFVRFIKDDFLPNCFRWINSPAGRQMAKTAESNKAVEREPTKARSKISSMDSAGKPKTSRGKPMTRKTTRNVSRGMSRNTSTMSNNDGENITFAKRATSS
uniref:Calponin-homology (CH) domain-containing protein n=1 Tax=Lotharella globosa TaxID=91324 RepID=A0A7S4DWJ0_9EUKA